MSRESEKKILSFPPLLFKIGAEVKVERASPIGGTRVTLLLPAAAREIS